MRLMIAVHSAEGCCSVTAMARTSIKQKKHMDGVKNLPIIVPHTSIFMGSMKDSICGGSFSGTLYRIAIPNVMKGLVKSICCSRS